MEKKNTFTKILAITGTILAWFPLLAPVIFGVVSLMTDGIFRFDYLMPAELFPVAMVGGGLLLWAALREKRRRGWVGGGLAAAVLLLVGGQALAMVSGLASGETEPSGLWFGVVVGSLVTYILALVAVGVGGILLLRDLYKRP